MNNLQGQRYNEDKIRLYEIWKYIKKRCCKSKCEEYKKYGSEGITICSGWKRDYPTFKIWALNSIYGKDLVVGPIDSDDNYEFFNCQQIVQLENAKKGLKHGGSRTRLYDIWCNMKQRCYNPGAENYKYYGGKGITVCPEWLNDYIAFKTWALANGYKEGLTIDRIKSNGNYEPSNCQWITQEENARKASKNLKRKGKEKSCSL